MDGGGCGGTELREKEWTDLKERVFAAEQAGPVLRALGALSQLTHGTAAPAQSIHIIPHSLTRTHTDERQRAITEDKTPRSEKK